MKRGPPVIVVVCALHTVQAQAGAHKDGNRLLVGAPSQAATYLATEQHRTPLALPNHNCPHYWGTEQIMERNATEQNWRDAKSTCCKITD